MFDKFKFKRCLRNIQSQDVNKQITAARILGELGDKRALEILVTATQGDNKHICTEAARALGELGDRRAIGLLVKKLGDEDGEVRQVAAQSLAKLGEPKWKQWIHGTSEDFNRLGKSGEPAAFEPLNRALGDPHIASNQAQRSVVLALGNLKDVRAVEPLITVLQGTGTTPRGAAAEALGKLGDKRAVEPLIQALTDENYNVRETAAQALGQLGDARAIEPLIGVLKERSFSFELMVGPSWQAQEQAARKKMSAVKAVAARALGRLGDKRALHPLIQSLKDEDSCVQEEAANALARLGADVSLEPLTDLLINGSGTSRQMAAFALGKIGDKRAFDLTFDSLVRAMQDKRRWVRLEVVKILGFLGDIRAVELLRKALKDKEEDVGKAAAQALGKLRDDPEDAALIEAMKKTHEIDKLLNKLRGGDGYAKQYAAAGLGRIRDPQAVDELVKALWYNGYNKDSVHRATVNALAEIHSPAAIKPLVRRLADSNEGIRKTVTSALSKLGERKWMKWVRGDNSDFERLIKSGDPDAREPFLGALVSSDYSARARAARRLAEMGEPKWAQWIKGEHDDFIRLAKSGEPVALDLLICALGGRNTATTVVDQAVKALGEIGDKRALEPITEVLQYSHRVMQKSHVRGHPFFWTVMAAVKALGKLGDQRAYALLADIAANSKSDQIKEAASEALAQLDNRGKKE